MKFKMLSGDSGQGASLCTPLSVSKRFCIDGSSSKRSLFGQRKKVEKSKEMETSGEDSDLGPMSPLAMTDNDSASRESSPGRSFVSPLMTPEKSPQTSARSWDRLGPKSTKDIRVSFDALRSVTKAARTSPKRKIFMGSPKSLPSTPTRKLGKNRWIVGTPEREIARLFNEEIIPETPRKESCDENSNDEDRIEETPEKKDAHRRLITPLSCVSNDVPIPRVHRRKSLYLSDDEGPSPIRRENLKRRASDHAESFGAKVPKVDDNHSVPRARAVLFPESKIDQISPKVSIDDFKLSTKSFYKSSLEKRGKSMGHVEWSVLERANKRHSLPAHVGSHVNRRRSSKRLSIRKGDMNSGVRHGIKKPKLKRHISRVEAFKTEEKKLENGAKENVENESKSKKESSRKKKVDATPPPPSPVADPNKRFFKTNMTANHRATITVNNNIKLKVSDGKIALNEKRAQKSAHKRPRLEDISFDATDLTVDEPNFDTSMEKTNVDGLLKVLEDDWAEDDYDTMETLTNVSPTRVPMKSVSLAGQDVTMSPASILTNMTLTMNIKDSGQNSENNNLGKKLYPLFEKGFSANFEEENKQKSDRSLKRSWQTSAKGGGAEDQYQIDAGQKKFGATTCNECGIVYQLGEPEDENAHLVYHNSVKILKFNGWKNERVIMTDPFTNSRIITIEPNDPKQCWKKVEQVLSVVDKDLGLADMEMTNYLDKKIYFYVRDKTILGILVAEDIKIAHRMIPDLGDLNCCSAEETSAKCGVNVVWTAMSHRRQKIATKLLDTLRTTFYFGYILSLDDIAFSIPTPSGKLFAEKYTKIQNFKVYT